eukprot:284818229_2
MFKRTVRSKEKHLLEVQTTSQRVSVAVVHISGFASASPADTFFFAQICSGAISAVLGQSSQPLEWLTRSTNDHEVSHCCSRDAATSHRFIRRLISSKYIRFLMRLIISVRLWIRHICGRRRCPESPGFASALPCVSQSGRASSWGHPGSCASCSLWRYSTRKRINQIRCERRQHLPSVMSSVKPPTNAFPCCELCVTSPAPPFPPPPSSRGIAFRTSHDWKRFTETTYSHAIHRMPREAVHRSLGTGKCAEAYRERSHAAGVRFPKLSQTYFAMFRIKVQYCLKLETTMPWFEVWDRKRVWPQARAGHRRLRDDSPNPLLRPFALSITTAASTTDPNCEKYARRVESVVCCPRPPTNNLAGWGRESSSAIRLQVGWSLSKNVSINLSVKFGKQFPEKKAEDVVVPLSCCVEESLHRVACRLTSDDVVCDWRENSEGSDILRFDRVDDVDLEKLLGYTLGGAERMAWFHPHLYNRLCQNGDQQTRLLLAASCNYGLESAEAADARQPKAAGIAACYQSSFQNSHVPSQAALSSRRSRLANKHPDSLLGDLINNLAGSRSIPLFRVEYLQSEQEAQEPGCPQDEALPLLHTQGKAQDANPGLSGHRRRP